jgi:hypothetical protein
MVNTVMLPMLIFGMKWLQYGSTCSDIDRPPKVRSKDRLLNDSLNVLLAHKKI